METMKMILRGSSILALVAGVLLSAPSLTSAQSRVHIIAEQTLYNSLQSEITQYINDLESEGYTTSLSTGNWTNPADIRSLLQASQSQGLVGAVLIGDIPMLKFNLKKNLGQSYRHDFDTPLYYMDLNGNWGGVTNGTYTTHTGDVDAEIWAGFIRADNLPGAGDDEPTLLRNYFDRVHAYRVKSMSLPPFRAFRFYSSIRPNYENLEALYSSIIDPGCGASPNLLRGYLDDPDGYDFGVINAASGVPVHHFHKEPFWPVPASYWLTDHKNDASNNCTGDCDITSGEVAAFNPKILFYHLATSETGRLDQPDNLSGHYIFGSDYGLAAIAATQHTIVGDSFYEPFAAGETFGESFRRDINDFLSRFAAGGNESTTWCPDWDEGFPPTKLTQSFYATLVVGDPTLRNRNAIVDETPPTISSLGVSNIGSASAFVSWTTSEDANGTVNYGKTTSYGQSESDLTTFQRSHGFVLQALEAGTTYNVQVISSDASGNSTTSSNITFTTSSTASERVSDGLISLYTFWEGSGTTVRDVGGNGTPLDLTISDASKTDWKSDGGLEFVSSGVKAQSAGAATKIIDEMTSNGQLTIEAWVKADNTTQTGPARIVSNSPSISIRNFTMGQDEADLQMRIRTPESGLNGSSPRLQIGDVFGTSLVHLVATFDGTVERVYINGVLQSSTLSLSGGISNWDDSFPLVLGAEADGSRQWLGTFYLVALYDRALNAADVQSNFDAGRPLTPPDLDAPVISNVAATPAATTAAVTWDTNEPATSQVEYGMDTSYGSMTSLDPNLVSAHSQALTGLTEKTTYHYRVHSRDAAGNSTTSADFTFTTTPADTVPPVISDVASSNVEDTTATITWTTNEPTDAQVEYGTDNSYGNLSSLNETPATSHSIVLDDLTPGITHHFRVRSRDAGGNLTVSNDYTLQTIVIDRVAPVISGISETVRSNSATIQWSTNEPATSQIEYGMDSSYGSMTALSSNLVLTHSQIVTGLSLQTTYHYRIISKDEAGNVRMSADRTFTTLDTDELPPVIDNIQVTDITGNSARVTWATDEPAFAQLAYGPTTALGTLIGNTTTFAMEHSLLVIGLQPNREYYFQARSGDETGNVATGALMSFRTSGAVEGAPVISNIRIDSLGASSAMVRWDTDIPGTSTIDYGLTTSYGFSAGSAALVTTHAVWLNALQPETAYHFRVSSAAGDGKTAFSEDKVFVTMEDEGMMQTTYRLEAETMPIQTTGQSVDNATAWELSSAGSIADSVMLQASGEYAIDIMARGVFSGNDWPDVELRLNGIPFARIKINTDAYQNYRLQLNILAGNHELSLAYVNPNQQGRLVAVDYLEISLLEAVDTQAPSISSISVTNISETSAEIRWQTSEPALAQIEYGPTQSLGMFTTETTELLTSQFITLRNLTANTTYWFRTRARDAAGNVGESELQVFQTRLGTDVDDDANPLVPDKFRLSESYPNPFHSQTRFRLALPQPGYLEAVVYNVNGRRVSVLHSGSVTPGEIALRWDGTADGSRSRVSNGTYAVRVRYRTAAGKETVLTRKIVLTR